MEGSTSQQDVNLVVQYHKQRQRPPHGLQAAFKAAQQAEPNSTERLFADASEVAFSVYFGVKRNAASARGFSGQGSLRDWLSNLEALPADHQRAVAKRLAAAMESAATESAIAAMETTAQKPADTGDGRGERCCALDVIDSDGNNQEKRRRVESGIQYPSFPTTTANSTRTNHHDSLERSADTYHEASLLGAKAVFRPEFMESIQRRLSTQQIWVADISLFLQKDTVREQFGCQMEIGIRKERVAYYAKKLCDVDVETSNGVRCLRYPNGTKAEPDPSVKLRSIEASAILEVFGSFVFEGFSLAPIRRQEEDQALDRTDGACMTIPSRETEGSIITLSLGDYHAFTIRDKLYRVNP